MSETATNERVAVTITAGVADVRLVRGDKMNAMDSHMFAALVDTSAELANNPDVRCVVLSGDRAFCAGLDFGNFQAMAGKADGEADRGGDDGGRTTKRQISDVADDAITHHGQQAVYGWTDLQVPVIAAITGVALGAGIQLALGADIRFIAPDAKMSVLEIRWGLVPDMTGTQRLVEILGLDKAKELVWTGRMVEGAEAVEMGLATHLADDPHAAALELAAEIASKSPDAIQAGKRLLRAAAMATEAEGFAAERQEIGALVGSPNQVESIQAFFEKRPANYT